MSDSVLDETDSWLRRQNGMAKRRLVLTGATLIYVTALVIVQALVADAAEMNRRRSHLFLAEVNLPILARIGLPIVGNGNYSTEHESWLWYVVRIIVIAPPFAITVFRVAFGGAERHRCGHVVWVAHVFGHSHIDRRAGCMDAMVSMEMLLGKVLVPLVSRPCRMRTCPLDASDRIERRNEGRRDV